MTLWNEIISDNAKFWSSYETFESTGEMSKKKVKWLFALSYTKLVHRHATQTTQTEMTLTIKFFQWLHNFSNSELEFLCEIVFAIIPGDY